MTSADFKRYPSPLSPTIPEQICIAYEQGLDVVCSPFGGVAERLNAPVLKTGDGRPSVGSNPTSSAIYIAQLIDSVGLFCICNFCIPLGVPLNVGWHAISLNCFGQITTVTSLYRRTFSPQAVVDIDY
jgi:hypothetical protein